MNGAKMAALREELVSIYFADVRYWRQGTKASREVTRDTSAGKIACDRSDVNFLIC
jgi:hypothetical protein